MTTTDHMELLSARWYGYGVFQRIMGDEPTQELIDVIDADVLSEAFSIMGVAEECISPLLDQLRDPSLDVDTLSSDYARIFVGPASLPAPPWESVYVDRKRVVMTETTLRVRNAYRAQGFVAKRYPHVPDDHLALELDFMAALAQEALEAAQEEGLSGEHCSTALQASSKFAKEHLNIWIKEFARDVDEKCKAAFYAAASKALAAFVDSDVQNVLPELETAISLA